MSDKKNWTVEMKCVVYKTVDVEGCTEEEARKSPWDFAVDEMETDQIDWDVLSVKEAK